MKVLIACEFSGTVRDAFAAQGHNAWSCDLLPTQAIGQHIQGDVIRVIAEERWDLMIAHPPCTYLSSSGLHWNKRIEGRQEKTEEALRFVRGLLDAPIPRIALENPIGCISTRIRKYDQKIQPWMFGHDASKGTCLWLKGLPALIHPGPIVPPAGWESIVQGVDYPTVTTIDGYQFGTLQETPTRPVWGNQTPSGQNKLGPSEDRWAKRSLTYPGIAKAMSASWGRV